MEWKNSGVIIAVAFMAMFIGMLLMYSLQKAQIDQEHEWDFNCYFSAAKTLSNVTSVPITCYSPFFHSKTTINLTLEETR